MKKIILVTFILLAGAGYCQKQYLLPVKDFKKETGDLKEYYDKIFPLLYEGLQTKPYARYTVLSKISKEYVVSVEKKDGKFYIISNTVSRGYWHTGNDEIKLVSTKTEISAELYDRIGALFQILIGDIQPETETALAGKTEYYFSATNKGTVTTGETQSPEYKSFLYRVTKACDNLASIGFGQNISQSEVQKEIEQLILEMK